MQVTLLSKTENMFMTIWNVWNASRSNDEIFEFITLAYCSIERRKEIKDLFFRIMEEDIPIAEMVDFVFLLEDIPISLREQLVRHRIGVKVDDRVGIDHVPDLADSSFWSQSMRVLDMSEFKYFIPESIGDMTPTTETGRYKIPAAVYNRAMLDASNAYINLIEAGIPKEDARNVIPLGATHRIVWKLNLSALGHILSKRGCWILQLGLWRPIIEGIMSELAEIDKRFRVLVCPPCIKKEKFTECKFCENNNARIKGDVDKLPPCPLYLHYYEVEAAELALTTQTIWNYGDASKFTTSYQDVETLMKTMRTDYQKLWGRNVNTGELLK